MGEGACRPWQRCAGKPVGGPPFFSMYWAQIEAYTLHHTGHDSAMLTGKSRHSGGQEDNVGGGGGEGGVVFRLRHFRGERMPGGMQALFGVSSA